MPSNPTKKIKNIINLYLTITQNDDSSYSYQYLSLMDNGVLVNLQGLKISEATTINVELTSVTNASYVISECLIPCGQKVISAEIQDNDENKVVVITDLDDEIGPKDYNFVIIAKNRHSQQQIICDPQVRNKGTR